MSELYAEREKVRLEQEKKKMEECTFKPKLCKGTEKRASTGKVASRPLAERMKQYMEDSEHTRIMTKTQIEQQKMQVRTWSI